MADRWSLRDVTEFDLLMQRGPDSVDALTGLPTDDSPSAVLKTWLRLGRPQHADLSRIAEGTLRAESLLRLALCLFGFVAGASLARGLLQYEGDRLINISAYLGVLVGGQLLLLLGLGLSLALARTPLKGPRHFLLPPALKSLSLPYAREAWGWRLFTTTQTSGIFFNLGVLAATFWRVVTQDLAFGWATTLSTDSADIHRLVSTLSTLWGGAGTPTPDQIQGSRIILSQGLAHLSGDSTAAWWPFLMLCVLFYGLVPRLLLALAGQARLHHALKYPPFSQPAAESLYQRLTRQPLRFQGNDAPASTSASSNKQLPALVPDGPLTLQADTDIFPWASDQTFTQTLTASTGLHLTSDADQTVGQVIPIEAWLPPLEESLRDLRQRRQSLGPDADLLLLLVGKPDPAQPGTPTAPAPEDVEVWQQRLVTLEDPRLGVFSWPGDPS